MPLNQAGPSIVNDRKGLKFFGDQHMSAWHPSFLRVSKGLLLVLIVLSAGCTSLKPRDFADSKTIFQPDRYFTGHVHSWGITENRRGEPHSRFVTDSFGKREANGDVIIQQTFHYGDGRTQQRTWHVHRLDAIHYEATANDVVGKARGEAQGNAFRWTYTIALKSGNPLSRVHLRQWMYLPEGTETLITRVSVKKFGIILQQVTESFERLPNDSKPEARSP